jgi:hypothetical protein
MRRRTTKTGDSGQSNIERDSAGVNVNLDDLANEEPAISNEDLIYQNGAEFKSMINRLVD